MAVGVAIESTARASRPHGCQQRLDADDVQHTREIVAEYVQRHFGRYIGQSLHQKVRRTHLIFSVANGCSTVSRRIRMACGF